MANMNFEDALELALQTTKKYIDDKIEINGFSGDYNDLANRPCYDDREFSEVELTFDGVLEGKETAQLMYYNFPQSISDPTVVNMFVTTEILEGFTLVRLSSKPVTYEELCTTTHLNIVSGNNHYEFDYSDIDIKDYIVKHNESVSTLTCPFYSNASLFSNSNMTKLENENDIVKAALISSDIYIKNIYAINEETDLKDVFGELYVKADRVLSPGIWMQYFALGDNEIEYTESIRYKEISSGELKKLDPKFIPNEIYKLLEPLSEDDIDFIINILDGI
jgi:hypothetical protein